MDSYSLYLSVLMLLSLLGFLSIREYHREWDILTFFHIGFGVFFVIAPLHVLVYRDTVTPENYTFEATSITSLQSVFLILFTYMIIYLSFHWSQTKFVRSPTSRDPKKLKLPTVDDRVFRYILYSLIPIAFISIYVYTSQYGGVLESIRLAPAIRSGNIEGSRFVFTKRLMPFSVVGLLISYSMLLRSEQFRRHWAVIGFFAVSLFLSAITILLLSGRFIIIELLILFYLIYFIHSGRVSIRLLILVGIVGIIIISFGTFLRFSFYYGELPWRLLNGGTNLGIRNLYFKFWSNFASPYISLEAAVSFTESFEPRLLFDVIYGLLHLLPQRLLGIDLPPTVSYLNTYFVTGKFESVVPPGMIGYFWYSGYMAGVIIGSLLFGGFMGIIKISLHEWRLDTLHCIVYFKFGMWFSYNLVRSTDPRVFLRSQIPWIVVITVLVGISIAYKLNED